jgi:hypothetical protein
LVSKHEGWTPKSKEEIEHYITKCKEHEERRASTDERNKYWYEYTRSKETSRDI